MNNKSVLPEQWKSIIKEAAEVVKRGGVILYPTDTIWGIGCDATNESAVKRIYEIKKRSDHKAMLLLIDNDAKLGGLVQEIPSMAYDLIDMSTKPLTIIYQGAKNVAPSLLGEDGSVGIRITQEPFSKALCAAVRVPLVSTSANLSGEKSPQTFQDIQEEIKKQVDYIVPIRQEETDVKQASTIISLGIHNEIKILRE